MLTKKELQEMEELLPKSVMFTIFYRNAEFKTLNSTPALHAFLRDFKYYKPGKGSALVLLSNKKSVADFWLKFENSRLHQMCEVTIIGKDFASFFMPGKEDLNK